MVLSYNTLLTQFFIPLEEILVDRLFSGAKGSGFSVILMAITLCLIEPPPGATPSQNQFYNQQSIMCAFKA